MRFSRLEQLIGVDTVRELASKTVLIIGLGGVGGSATEAIARSGFGHLIIVDQDVVDESNINRQIIALDSTMHQPKVEVMRDRIHDINPQCNVTAYHQFYNHETKHKIWEHNIDFVIDCIDTITFKIDIIKEATNRKIPVISVMGTGNKYHPEQLAIMPLSKTEYDPIARVIRHKLRHDYPMNHIAVVASKEMPEKVDSTTMKPSSNAFVPNTAGILAASYIFNIAIGKTSPL